jgi:hypothetical protein
MLDATSRNPLTGTAQNARTSPSITSGMRINMRNTKYNLSLASLLCLCVCCPLPLAGAATKSTDSPVALVVPAQLLSAEIRIESEGTSWESRLVKIGLARQYILNAAAAEGLSARVDQPLISHHPLFGGSTNATDMIISASIDDKSDMVKIVQRFEGIVARLSVENKVSVSIGRIFLAVENPESFRGELLRQIRTYVEGTAKSLSDAPNYAITGLEQAVQARQLGDRDIEVFIPFSVTYGPLK